MKIFSWNCRGLGGTDTPIIPYISWSVRYYDTSIVFLQETKCSVADGVCKTSPLNLPHFCGTDSVGTSGGLLLLWDDRSDILPLVTDPHFILCKVVNRGSNSVWFALFLYGESCTASRANFWNNMKALCSAYSPLCMIGDFNQLEHHFDKLGGSSNIAGWKAFLDWRISTPLSELPFSGPQFTWANKRNSSSLILERLDRCYASENWILSFPDAHVQNLNIFLSDHAPIVLSTTIPCKKPKRPYRVDNWCLDNPEIHWLISSIWNTSCQGPASSAVSFKLSQIRSGILKWVLQNRHRFMIDWSSISHDLSASASLVHDSSSGLNYINNTNSMEHEVHIQHSFWKQRAKSDFQFNDGIPTSYFFSRSKSRQKRLRLISLKNDMGNWTSSDLELSQLVMSHFASLYSSSNQTLSFSALEDLSIPHLDGFQQDFLSQPFTSKDVEKAFFSIKPNKSPGPDGFPPRFYQLYWKVIKDDISTTVPFFF
ncbi:uncharacterized protein LOC141633330 [Silene latifolia]|uniref:uncharacterized protein LOC141633330 n=1 Tax=Silene latifolia TaxID=37657 RepID=UPI003D76B8B9